MKKISLYLLALMPLLFAACDADDDSTVASGTVPTIEIGEFQEDGYNIVSYQGNHLQITPQITTGYSDGQLTYNWYLVDDLKDNQARANYKNYEWVHIAEGRNLDYEVNLAPGTYYVYLEVKADNGYAVTQNAKLLTSTDFTNGYYIMKQTADGNTELDIFKPEDERLLTNLLEATTGQALEGAPLMLSMSVQHGYIDEDTNEQAGTNLATVTTSDKLIRAMRTSDLRSVLSNDNMLYEPMGGGEQPYGIVSGYFSNYLFTSEGVRSQYMANMMPSSGTYGIAGGAGGSRFLVFDSFAYYCAVWAESSHTLYTVDFNGSSNYFDDPAFPVNNLTDWECLACGFNALTDNAVFLLENSKTGLRELVYVSLSFAGQSISNIVPLDSSLHLAKGNVFTVSYYSSAYFYTVDGNKIYGYNLLSGDEQEISAQGISGETINYISDKYVGDEDFFVIGTQSGNNYTLRFYNQLGGMPDGQPVYTFTGTGRVVSVKYTSSTLSGGQAKIQD